MPLSRSESESDSGTEMEALPVLMEKRRLKGIVVLKGLPSTCKTELAHRIGSWAKCPMLCIQDFLGGGGGSADYYEGAAADFSPPTATDQVELHHRKAFTTLLNVAHRLLVQGGCHCVVIKSSLHTPYELQLLLQLPRYYEFRLVILECKVRNKFLWRQRFEELSLFFPTLVMGTRRWSRPRSWKDIEKALDYDCAADKSRTWDLNHPPYEMFVHAFTYVAWLGVDPFHDLTLSATYDQSDKPLPNEFNDAIKYLLSVPSQELPQNPYVVDYDEFRRFLFDQKLMAAARKGRSESLCQEDCVFRYCQVPEDDEASFCGVCQGEISRQPSYSCHFCATTLDKTCAEMFPLRRAFQSIVSDIFWYWMVQKSVKHPCKACEGGGKEFSEECRSCIFQDRLKCHLFPTILNHTCHPHFLSIQLVNQDCRCKACGFVENFLGSYGCKSCAFYCHIHCTFLPLELKHEHGGHEHVMKLMYTRDAMDEEEDPIWCDFCYQDMDPELWYYTCLYCPHYVVHPSCCGSSKLPLNDPKMVKFVEQLQSQLDDWRAAGNSIQPC